MVVKKTVLKYIFSKDSARRFFTVQLYQMNQPKNPSLQNIVILAMMNFSAS